MSGFAVLHCSSPPARIRAKLAFLGEAQLCPGCGQSLVLSPSWKFAVLLLQLGALVGAFALADRLGGLLSFGIGGAAIVFLQLALWAFVPIEHLPATRVPRRGRIYLAGGLALASILFLVAAWVLAQR